MRSLQDIQTEHKKLEAQFRRVLWTVGMEADRRSLASAIDTLSWVLEEKGILSVPTFFNRCDSQSVYREDSVTKDESTLKAAAMRELQQPPKKREGELKSRLTDELVTQIPTAIIQFFASAGSPDRSITFAGRTTHWECKHGTPGFDSLGLQELTCARLAVQGHCRYIVWQENKFGQGKRTMILRPRQVAERVGWNFEPEEWCVGFDMKWLILQIRKCHGL